VIKTCATGGVLSLNDAVDTPQLTQEELNASWMKRTRCARRPPRTLTVLKAPKRAIRAGIDSIEHGTFLDDEALDMMKARGTVLIPTLMAAEGGREKLNTGATRPLSRPRCGPRSSHRPNMKRPSQKVSESEWERMPPFIRTGGMRRISLAGGSGVAADRSITGRYVVDAEASGNSDKLGTSSNPESWRIFVVIPGDPIQNIRRLRVIFVMKEGSDLPQ